MEAEIQHKKAVQVLAPEPSKGAETYTVSCSLSAACRLPQYPSGAR
jgi:hypothetical protein